MNYTHRSAVAIATPIDSDKKNWRPIAHFPMGPVCDKWH